MIQNECYFRSVFMRKNDLIEKKAAEVQSHIVHCSDHEPMVEGGILWMTASGTCVQDLMYDCNVPDKLQQAVCERLRCPKCGDSLDLLTEVGTKYRFELDHEETIEHALDRHSKELFKFYDFLHKFPMSGMAHRFGRRLFRELLKAPHLTLPEGLWFRAKPKPEQCCGLAPRENVGDQRYNSSGHPFFYLANNPTCAAVELLASADQKSAWVQSFHVDKLEDVLDLRPWDAEDDRVFDGDGNYSPKHPLLLIALLYSDLLLLKPRLKGKAVIYKSEYLMPRFVSDAARLAGFSAILFPSVRYDGDNLVVFKEDWTPKPDGEPREETLTEEDLDYSNRTGFHEGQRWAIPNIDLAFAQEIMADPASEIAPTIVASI
jgi:hypothetical protein